MPRNEKLSKTMAEIFKKYDRIEIPEWGAIYRKKPGAADNRRRSFGSILLGLAAGVTVISVLVAFIPTLIDIVS